MPTAVPLGAHQREPYAQPAVCAPFNPALKTLLESRHILLLQGPVGPFFDRMTRWLRSHGKAVDRVVFQGGDRADCRELVPHCYTATPDEWAEYFRSIVSKRGVDCIVLFGQSRYYHKVAREQALEAGIAVVVLEEGYLRPGYVTMELNGVNGYSCTLDLYRWQSSPANPRVALPQVYGGRWLFQQMCWHAARHYLALHRARHEFPHYQHHKSESLEHYAAYWLRAWGKKLLHSRSDQRRVRELTGQHYFFVPLQHDGDAQIIHHSPYSDNTEFILRVLQSFAADAPADAKLVFKTHPFSRGGPGHVGLIFALAHDLGIRDRVLHLIEGHIPTLLAHARGVVVINSTVGLQALVHNKPLAVGGDALYKVDGLVHPGPLSSFWSSPCSPDPVRLQDFLEQLRHLTQAPCHVYDSREESLEWTAEPTLWRVK